MARLIKDLIEVPERVHMGDYVLRLTDGVLHPESTLRDYKVTPQLRDGFDEAIGFIRSALDSGSSKAAYLHGSFGSGKSHFMAVLHLLLQNNAAARSLADLAPVIARHGGWLEGKKLLLVPYHMITSRVSMAQVAPLRPLPPQPVAADQALHLLPGDPQLP